MTLPQGSFKIKLYRIDARTQFNPWISLTNNVQYDSESGTLSALDRRGAAKIVRTFRF